MIIYIAALHLAFIAALSCPCPSCKPPGHLIRLILSPVAAASPMSHSQANIASARRSQEELARPVELGVLFLKTPAMSLTKMTHVQNLWWNLGLGVFPGG